MTFLGTSRQSDCDLVQRDMSDGTHHIVIFSLYAPCSTLDVEKLKIASASWFRVDFEFIHCVMVSPSLMDAFTEALPRYLVW